MTIKKTCFCDWCKNDLNIPDRMLFTITHSLFGTIHFCDIQCMRNYLEKKWEEMDRTANDE